MLLTLPDPRIALNQFPPAHNGKPQLNATFRHRRVAGRAEVTVEPDTGARWLVTIDIRAGFRGIFRLAIPFSRIVRTKLQQALDEMDPQALDEAVKAAPEWVGTSPDSSMMATSAMDALLADIAEVVPPVESP